MSYSINAKKRGNEKNDKIRAEGLIPAVLYGPEIEPVSVSVEYNVFEKLYNEAGESSLIDFSLEGSEPTKVIIQDLQHDPVKGRITHIDFRQIKMGEEMHVSIELEYVGEPLAVKELGGTLVKGNDYVNAKCLPKDLVSSIEVDLNVLKTFDDVIKISDLKLPEGIEVLDNPDSILAKVSAPLTEDQLKAMEDSEPASVEDVKVEEKGKGEEGENGDEKKEEK